MCEDLSGVWEEKHIEPPTWHLTACSQLLLFCCARRSLPPAPASQHFCPCNYPRNNSFNQRPCGFPVACFLWPPLEYIFRDSQEDVHLDSVFRKINSRKINCASILDKQWSSYSIPVLWSLSYFHAKYNLLTAASWTEFEGEEPEVPFFTYSLGNPNTSYLEV